MRNEFVFILHQTLAIISIWFIGALLLAIFKARINKHAVVIAFLILSWLSAWQAMIPLILNFRELHFKSALVSSNRVFLKRVCNADAIITSAFWTAIPEVLRVLINVGRMTKEKKECSGSIKSNMKFEIELGLESFIVNDKEVTECTESSSSISSRYRSRILKRCTAPGICLFSIPILNSSAVVILLMVKLAQSDWTEIRAYQFHCASSNEQVNEAIVLFSLFQLLSVAILAMIAVIIYLIQHCQTKDQELVSSFGTHLIIKMLFLSFLAAIGTGFQWYSTSQLDDRYLRHYQSFQSIYMISFPFFISMLFIDDQIRKEWKTWIPTFHFLFTHPRPSERL
ncbi:membrane protein [Melampsora americana]|nr:membrane protein [Melampsora americana]